MRGTTHYFDKALGQRQIAARAASSDGLARKTYIKSAVAIVVVLGTITLTTAPASGSEPVYFSSTTGEYPVKATTTVTNMTVLEDGEDSIACAKVEYSSELTKSSETLTLTPSYSECTGDIEGTKASATVTPGSCKMELSKYKEGEEIEEEVSSATGDESIGPSGCGPIKMEDSASKCTFEVSSQGPASGATDTFDGESGIEITSKLSNASVTYTKGCGKPCSKIKLEHPTVWIIVHGLWRLYEEIEAARVRFIIGGVQIAEGGTQQFRPSERVIIEVKNRNRLLPIWEKEMNNSNGNWKFYNKAGEPSTFCYPVFYFPGNSCRFELESPAAKGEVSLISIKGEWFIRALLKVEVI
jgi:hypothetical protein